MTEDSVDFIAKLRQIEEQANVLCAELPEPSLRARLQHLVLLARTLRGRLELGVVALVRIDPEATLPGEREKPPA